MKDPEPRLVSEAELTVPEPYAVLHVGSDWACQQWSQEGWAEVGDRLVDEYRLITFPTVTGDGDRLFATGTAADFRFTTIESADTATLTVLRRDRGDQTVQ